MTRTSNPWLRLGLDAWMLGVEAGAVIGLRTLKLAAGGPAAQVEAERMVQEKLDAGLALQTRLLSGSLGGAPETVARRTLTHYRRKVRANRRRLSKA